MILDIFAVLFGVLLTFVWFQKFAKLEEKHASGVDTIFKEFAVKAVKYFVPFLLLQYIDISGHTANIMEFFK